MRLQPFLLYRERKYPRPPFVSPERWQAACRWYQKRMELGEPVEYQRFTRKGDLTT